MKRALIGLTLALGLVLVPAGAAVAEAPTPEPSEYDLCFLFKPHTGDYIVYANRDYRPNPNVVYCVAAHYRPSGGPDGHAYAVCWFGNYYWQPDSNCP